ncbi:endothelin-converting enzyme 1 [Rhipicephalus sanguineus]|uniref:endothelin-converting enzyme 1 n=1 Tax=Rhipicephalus sanguineus TaxID=34632 RepID=UPI001894BF0E|nr:endothelin-converting enzyme 1 [Rhipicephalus sanguineus]
MRVFGRRPSVVTLKDDDNSTSRTRLGGSSSDGHLPTVLTITRSYRRFLPVISGPFAAFSELRRRHPSLLPCLMCMAVACGGLALAMVLMRQQVKLDATLLSSANVCGTKDCREQAARIAMNIDAKRDPCEDLYAYTCGGAKASESKRRSLMSSYVESVKGFIQRGLVPEERNSSGAAYKAYSAFNACLSRPAGGVDAAKPFVEFMSARKIPWPSSAPLDADPLDVLVDLAVNWRVPLLFDVRLLYTGRENSLVVAIDQTGDVALLRMEQLSASGQSAGEYDDLLRSVAGYLRQGTLLSDEDCRQLRQDESSVRNNVTSIARSEEEEEVDVFVAFLNDSVSETGPTWLTLLQRHLGRDVELSPSTKLLAHNGRHLHAVLTLLASVPRDRLLNVIGWTFAYSYLWLVHPDSNYFQPGRESDVFDGQAACFLAVQESYGTLLVAPQFLAYFHQQADRQRLFDMLNETTQALARAVLASGSLANATKRWAVEKILHRTRRELWPPEPFFHAELLDELYEEFPATVTSSDLFKSLFESRRAARRILRNSYYGRLLTGGVRWPAREVRYWYGGDLLRVGLSALFPPSYYRDDAGVSAYSGLGFQIARALVRTVDERGRTTDGTARVLWKQVVANCRLDSASTSRERDAVARLFALDVALAALRSNAQNRLEGLEGLEQLTGLQTFYVNFCGKFCGHRHGAELCNVAMNASEFGDAFECPAVPSLSKDRRCLFI